MRTACRGWTALLAALAAACAPAPSPEVLTAPVARHDVLVAVRALGRLEAARSTVVASGIRGDRGTIVSIAADGERVAEGDVLVRLDPTPFEEEIARLEALAAEQEAAVEVAGRELDWERVQAGREAERAALERTVAELDLRRLEQGEGPLELARLEGEARDALEELGRRAGYLEDLEELEGRGFANPAETAAARRAVEAAEAEGQRAGSQLASYRDFALPALLGTGRARLARAEADAGQAAQAATIREGKADAALRRAGEQLAGTRAALAAARAELARTVLRAPIPGMVVLREGVGGGGGVPKVGDRVWQGQPLIYLPDLTRMIVRTSVREIDLHRVVVGRPAAVTVDAYPDLRLAGRVASIGVMAEGRGEARGTEPSFEVVVELDGEDPRLRPGMTARAEIRFAEAPGALAVAPQAVFHEGDGTHCWVAVDGGFARRPVVTGLASEEWVEIRGGLEEGEAVALSAPPAPAR